MNSVCAKLVAVGSGYHFGGGRYQCRMRVQASVAAVSAPASTAVAVSMYEVLVVDETAKPEEIKAAYRRTTRWWHLDACSGGADRFMAVWESYEVLSDRKRRRAYDIQLRYGGGGAAGY
jgi:hypothetical protein